MRIVAKIGIGLVFLGAFGGAAGAADLDYPPPANYAAPDPQFEFGTGWYLRGDVSADYDAMPKTDAFGVLDTRHSDWAYGLSGGFGYKWNGWFRTDITGDYLQSFSYGAASTDGLTNVRASFDRFAILANGYVDLGTWFGGVTPYIGGGVGAGILDPNVTLSAPLTGNSKGVSVADSAKFAWAVMAGISYAVDNHIIVDLGYRHLDLGRYSFDAAGYARNTAFSTATFNRAATRFNRDLTSDQIRLGIRYMID